MGKSLAPGKILLVLGLPSSHRIDLGIVCLFASFLASVCRRSSSLRLFESHVERVSLETN